MKNRLVKAFAVSFVFVLLSSFGHAQEAKLQPGDRERGRNILGNVWDSIKKNYYDPKYHGVDMQARYKEALTRIDTATSFNQMLGIVAWFTEGVNDSHTFFIPPAHAFKLDYGWRAKMIGDRCFVTHVRPGTDAEKQGLKSGDEVESINGLVPTRDTLHKIQYVLNVLRPQPGLHLALRSPKGEERTLEVLAAIKPTNRQITIDNFMDEIRDYERSSTIYERKAIQVGDVVVWKLHDFDMVEKGADNVIKEARKGKGLVLDLRGNPGGSAEAVIRMLGGLFEQDVSIATYQARRKLNIRPTAKGAGGGAYTGKLIVLVDSESASASEIFARVVQLEHRGTVMGDRSAGAVMLARHYPIELGLMEHAIYFGASVTEADLIMKDGKSLEHTGVAPDEVVLPTADDLASGRDPVLAQAVKEAGASLSPEDAGKLFPFKWVPQ